MCLYEYQQEYQCLVAVSISVNIYPKGGKSKVRKYEITGNLKAVKVEGREIVLHRIIAATDFGTVRAGELGGWIEKESNLSHSGDAWIKGDAIVCDDARVYGNAQICSDAVVCCKAVVCGNTIVSIHAEISGNAEIKGYASVGGDAQVYGNAIVGDKAWIYDSAVIGDDAKVGGNAVVCGNAEVFRNADIVEKHHVLVIGATGSRNDFTTFYRGMGKQIMVKCGCFNGILEEFLDKVKETHGNNHHAEVYRAAAEVAKAQIGFNDTSK